MNNKPTLFDVLTLAVTLLPNHGFSCHAVTAAAQQLGVEPYNYTRFGDSRRQYEEMMAPDPDWPWVSEVEYAARTVKWSYNDYRQFMLSMAAESVRPD